MTGSIVLPFLACFILIMIIGIVDDSSGNAVLLKIVLSVCLVLFTIAGCKCNEDSKIGAEYFINHQNEFIVDTISVNGVITELKIKEK